MDSLEITPELDDKEAELRWAKLSPYAFEPAKGSAGAAGVMLRSAYEVVIPARGNKVVDTDLQMLVPVGSYGRVMPLSGIPKNSFIDVGVRIIDSNFHGNVGVVLYNHSDELFVVKPGDPIAQIICERIFYPELVQVKDVSSAESSESGSDVTTSDDATAESTDEAKETSASDAEQKSCKRGASLEESVVKPEESGESDVDVETAAEIELSDDEAVTTEPISKKAKVDPTVN